MLDSGGIYTLELSYCLSHRVLAGLASSGLRWMWFSRSSGSVLFCLFWLMDVQSVSSPSCFALKYVSCLSQAGRRRTIVETKHLSSRNSHTQSHPLSLLVLSTSVLILSIHLLTNSPFSPLNFSFSLSVAFFSIVSANKSSCTLSTSFFFSRNSSSRSLSLRSREASCRCTDTSWDVNIVLEVVREVFWALEAESWVLRVERAAWVAVRSWRRRVSSSLVGVFEVSEVGSEVVEGVAMLLRSARRVSGYC
jgi:hypothetical protein